MWLWYDSCIDTTKNMAMGILILSFFGSLGASEVHVDSLFRVTLELLMQYPRDLLVATSVSRRGLSLPLQS